MQRNGSLFYKLKMLFTPKLPVQATFTKWLNNDKQCGDSCEISKWGKWNSIIFACKLTWSKEVFYIFADFLIEHCKKWLFLGFGANFQGINFIFLKFACLFEFWIRRTTFITDISFLNTVYSVKMCLIFDRYQSNILAVLCSWRDILMSRRAPRGS